MKALTKAELDKILSAFNSETSTHVFIHSKYEEWGYEFTQGWIRQIFQQLEGSDHKEAQTYLEKRIIANERFEPYKEELLSITLQQDEVQLETWVNELNKIGKSKQLIYEILLELFVFVQHHPETKNVDPYYDFVADFLDRFTAWGKNFKILENEPDCQ